MNTPVKTILKVIATLTILTGAVWVLQGINILPGSFMTGDPQWAVNGGISIFIGVVLFWFANRK
jgi:hypothetical protein